MARPRRRADRRSPGCSSLRLDVRTDERGWFEETWQRAKMTAARAARLRARSRTTSRSTSAAAPPAACTPSRGTSWSRSPPVAAYGAWVDLRDGRDFGTTYAVDLEPGVAVFVPRGVGQRLPDARADATAYTYLVNDHWRPDAAYVAVDLADPTLAIAWPIPLDGAELSEKDRTAPAARRRRRRCRRADRWCSAPTASSAGPCAPRSRAPRGVDPRRARPHRPRRSRRWPWGDHDVVLNAAAYTAVDRGRDRRRAARRLGGQRRRARDAGPAGDPARLHARALLDRLRLRRRREPSTTRTSRSRPLGVYGQSKAAGDLAVATAPRHYLVRTSWVVGDGPNFVRTMARLAGRRGRSGRGRRPGRPAHLHRRDRPRDPTPARRAARRTAPTT